MARAQALEANEDVGVWGLLFAIFVWLHWGLVAALPCGMRTLSCGMGDLAPDQDQTQAPALEARNLSHCTTREVPGHFLNNCKAIITLKKMSNNSLMLSNT